MQKAIWLEQMQYGPKRLAPKTLRFTSYCDLQKTAYIRNKTGKSHWISWLTLQKLLICVNHIIYGSTVLIVQHVQQSYSDICITFLGDGPKISTNVQLWKNSTDIFAKSAAFCSSVDQWPTPWPPRWIIPWLIDPITSQSIKDHTIISVRQTYESESGQMVSKKVKWARNDFLHLWNSKMSIDMGKRIVQWWIPSERAQNHM